jgi:ribonuclease P protein component
LVLPATLSKRERLHSRKLIDTLFNGNKSKATTVFPVRAVFMPLEDDMPSQLLISVPKRHFKRAVKRNRIKRLVREAYRRNKVLLDGKHIALAFIWMSNSIPTAQEVERKIVALLHRISEQTDAREQSHDPITLI